MHEAIIPLGAFAMVVAIVYLNIRKRERLALIEKGLSPSFFETRNKMSPSLKWGVILVSLGLGMFVARIIYSLKAFDRIDEAYLSMLLLFGGISLLVTNFLEIKLLKTHKHEEKEKLDE